MDAFSGLLKIIFLHVKPRFVYKFRLAAILFPVQYLRPTNNDFPRFFRASMMYSYSKVPV